MVDSGECWVGRGIRDQDKERQDIGKIQRVKDKDKEKERKGIKGLRDQERKGKRKGKREKERKEKGLRDQERQGKR